MENNTEDVNQCAKWLHSEHSSAAVDIFGEPEKTTRIGDEYQAHIPALMTENEQSQHIELDPITDLQNEFAFGLSVPLVWVHDQHKNKQETIETRGYTHESDGLVLVPGLLDGSWSVTEHDSFLLGLYTFGKNLRLVNRFMGDKGMENVLPYYYGKFYRTDEHQKWSKYRKERSKRSMPGKKIFTGWRQEELLSRLFPKVTDECKATLKEASRAFDDGKLSFVKYVFALRDTVGIDLLVEAIAIGNDNRDLTSKATKTLKNKFRFTSSSLKPQEIVNLLKDGIVLSKSRLSELFWKAVWPCLLASGWHSEQPRNYAIQNKKQSLVFLAPGVAKFSRRSLEKGSQYFENLTDVLNKVASEPHLLEPGPDHNKWVHPRGSDDEQDSTKFTILDTSSVCRGDKAIKLRSLGPLNKNAMNNVDPMVSKKEDKKSDGRPTKKLKLIVIAKRGRPRLNYLARNDTENSGPKPSETSNEAVEEAFKRRRMVIDLNHHRVAPDSDGGKPLRSPKPSSTQPTSGHRQSTRNRPLSKKALEALASGITSPKKTRKDPTDKTRKRVRAKTARVSSCGVMINDMSNECLK